MKRISILLLLLVLCIGAVAQTIDGQLPADLEQMEETGIPVETALPASFAQSVNNGSGLEFGARIRGLKEVSRGSSWWIGTKIEMVGRDLCFMSLKFGKSF